MFDQFQGAGGYEPKWFGVKILIVGAALALLSFGLCGVAFVIHSDNTLVALGFFGLIGSGCLMALGVIVTLMEVVANWIRNRLDDDEEER